MFSILIFSALIFAVLDSATLQRIDDLKSFGLGPLINQKQMSDEEYKKFIQIKHREFLGSSSIKTFIWSAYESSNSALEAKQAAFNTVEKWISILKQNPENREIVEIAKSQQKRAVEAFFEPYPKSVWPKTASEANLSKETILKINDLDALGYGFFITQGQKSDEQYADFISEKHKSIVNSDNIKKHIWNSYEYNTRDRATVSEEITNLIKVLRQNPENYKNGVVEAAQLQQQRAEKHFIGATSSPKTNSEELEASKVLDDAKSKMEPLKEAMISLNAPQFKIKFDVYTKGPLQAYKNTLDAQVKNYNEIAVNYFKDRLSHAGSDLNDVKTIVLKAQDQSKIKNPELSVALTSLLSTSSDSKPRKAGLFDTFKSKDLLPVDKKPGFMDKLVNTFKPKASSPPTNETPKRVEPRP